MDSSTETICPSCLAAVAADAYFCPNCGKALKNKPTSASVSRQIIVYAVSLFLPPFGLWYVWKYLRQADKKSKIIGAAALVLTIVSTIMTMWATKAMLDSINQSINALNF